MAKARDMASLFRRKLVISKPFQSLITDATADLTVQPDWGQFMEISDQVATFAREDPAKCVLRWRSRVEGWFGCVSQLVLTPLPGCMTPSNSFVVA